MDARLFVTEWHEVFVNPFLASWEDHFQFGEGCLSLPGVTVEKTRWDKITLADGRTFAGEQAIVIQHEIDHLNGVLITDFLRPRIPS